MHYVQKEWLVPIGVVCCDARSYYYIQWLIGQSFVYTSKYKVISGSWTCVHGKYTQWLSHYPLLRELNRDFLLSGGNTVWCLVRLALKEGIGVLGLRGTVDWVLSLSAKWEWECSLKGENTQELHRKAGEGIEMDGYSTEMQEMHEMRIWITFWTYLSKLSFANIF